MLGKMDRFRSKLVTFGSYFWRGTQALANKDTSLLRSLYITNVLLCRHLVSCSWPFKRFHLEKNVFVDHDKLSSLTPNNKTSVVVGDVCYLP